MLKLLFALTLSFSYSAFGSTCKTISEAKFKDSSHTVIAEECDSPSSKRASWNLAIVENLSGAKRYLFKDSRRCDGLVLSPDDGTVLCQANYTAIFLNVATGKVTHLFEDIGTNFVYSPNGKQVLVACKWDDYCKSALGIIDLDSEKIVPVNTYGYSASWGHFSPDSNWLYVELIGASNRYPYFLNLRTQSQILFEGCPFPYCTSSRQLLGFTTDSHYSLVNQQSSRSVELVQLGTGTIRTIFPLNDPNYIVCDLIKAYFSTDHSVFVSYSAEPKDGSGPCESKSITIAF